jgi:hypothetical protein
MIRKNIILNVFVVLCFSVFFLYSLFNEKKSIPNYNIEHFLSFNLENTQPKYVYEIRYQDLTFILHEQMVYNQDTYFSIYERAIEIIRQHFGSNLPPNFEEDIFIAKTILK